MATTTLPRQQGLSRGRWIGGGIAVIIVMIVVALLISSLQSRTAPQTAATVSVTRGAIVASVAGSGTVVAAQSLDLPFQASGSVTAVLVHEGDTVTAGQPLAQLDDRELRSQVAAAQANLESAKAQQAQAQQGNA